SNKNNSPNSKPLRSKRGKKPCRLVNFITRSTQAAVAIIFDFPIIPIKIKITKTLSPDIQIAPLMLVLFLIYVQGFNSITILNYLRLKLKYLPASRLVKLLRRELHSD